MQFSWKSHAILVAMKEDVVEHLPFIEAKYHLKSDEYVEDFFQRHPELERVPEDDYYYYANLLFNEYVY